MLERIFVGKRYEKALVVVLGQVVPLTRCLPSLVAGVVPWLAGQREAPRLSSSRPRAARSPHLPSSRPGASSGVGTGWLAARRERPAHGARGPAITFAAPPHRAARRTAAAAPLAPAGRSTRCRHTGAPTHRSLGPPLWRFGRTLHFDGDRLHADQQLVIGPMLHRALASAIGSQDR